jgi:hypothetical protein
MLMLKTQYRGSTVAACCFLVLIVIIVWLTTPAIYSHCYKDEYTSAKDCSPYNVVSFCFVSVGKFLSDNSGAVTAIATMFIAWFTLTVNDHRLKAVASAYGLKPDWVGPRADSRAG